MTGTEAPKPSIAQKQDLPELIALVDAAMRDGSDQSMLSDYPLVYRDLNLKNIHVVKVRGTIVTEVPYIPKWVRFERCEHGLGIISPTAGAFPSDLVSDGSGSLYSVNDAIIPATVLKFPASGGSAPTPTVQITASDLIDHDGTQPATAPGVIDYSGGLFGAFTGDLEIIDNRWLFVTVGSGNSLSQTNGSLLRLANLVLIDTVQGQVVQTVNLAWTHIVNGQDNTGAPFAGIPQSLPSQVAFVPSTAISGTGRIYVAMSNGAGDSNGLSVWMNGTVQVNEVMAKTKAMSRMKQYLRPWWRARSTRSASLWAG